MHLTSIAQNSKNMFFSKVCLFEKENRFVDNFDLLLFFCTIYFVIIVVAAIVVIIVVDRGAVVVVVAVAVGGVVDEYHIKAQQ